MTDDRITLDPQSVLSAYQARTRILLQQHADREAAHLDEIAYLEAYVAQLRTRIAELDKPEADAWGDKPTP